MANRIKPVLSFMCIGLFMLIAISSELLDESTNTLILVKDCEEMPAVTGTLTITVQYLDSYLEGVEDATVNIYITHQILAEEITCIAELVDSRLITLYTNEFGRCSYTLPESFTHTSTADLFRVQVEVHPHPDDSVYIPYYEETKVAVYNVTDLDFFKQAPKPL